MGEVWCTWPKGERLSLATVSWLNRLVAVFIALCVAILLFAPADDLRSWMLRGVPLAPEKLIYDFENGIIRSVVLFPLIFYLVVQWWALPVLFMFHVALWLRTNFLGFVASGMLAGVFGSLVGEVFGERHFQDFSYGPYFEVHYLRPIDQAIRVMTIVNIVCGGGGAAVAWCYMRHVQKRSLKAPQ